MCRFLAYSGEPILLEDLLLRPERSLVAQSLAAAEDEDRVHADGVGVGWYQREISPFPAVFRWAGPAWSCANLRSLCALTRSSCFLAHVRSASPGLEVTELNCHPFSFGPFLWMHNGTLGGHQELRDWARRFLSRAAFAPIRGTTDSEHLFALFIEEWLQAGEPQEPGALLDCLRRTLSLVRDVQEQGGVTEPSTLNLALSDGVTTIVTRAASPGERPLSLHLARGVRPESSRRPSPGSASAGAGADARGGAEGGVIVASEPLFAASQWEAVPPQHAVVVREGRGATLVELS
jgi:predicted glutamine amidotransferase